MIDGLHWVEWGPHNARRLVVTRATRRNRRCRNTESEPPWMRCTDRVAVPVGRGDAGAAIDRDVADG
jgi:hypothetical protein